MVQRRLPLIVVVLFSLGMIQFGVRHSIAQEESKKFATYVLSLSDLVLAEHIDPPARQQMILSCAKAMYQASDRSAPSDISETVSNLGTKQELESFLLKVPEELTDLESPETSAVFGLSKAIPGGASLIQRETNQVNQSVLNNRYVGTGIALTSNDEYERAQITRVFYNGPAYKAGIKKLDLILEIDGESTKDMVMSDVVERLRGESGSDVEVIVQQPGKEETRNITMTRGRVFIPSVEGTNEISPGQWNYTIGEKLDVAYIRFTSIGPSTLHELRKISAELNKKDLRGLIIDLRMGSGILHDTIMVADSMIDGGTIGHVRTKKNTIKYDAQPGDIFEGLPIVILVSKSTSGGNVFLTAALQDNDRAVVVGEPTGGVTFVNRYVSIPESDSSMRLATGIMMRGDGTPLLAERFLHSSPTLNLSESDQPKLPGFILPDHAAHFNPTNAGNLDRQGLDKVVLKAAELLRAKKGQASSQPRSNISGD